MKNKKLCTKENLWSSPTTLDAASSSVKFESSFFTIDCDSSMSVLAKESYETQILGQITELTWTGCTSFCTQVTAKALPSAALLAVEGQDGLLHLSSFVIVMSGCALGAQCTFELKNPTLPLYGGETGSTAQIVAANVKGNRIAGSAFLCGESMIWASWSPYVVTEVNGSTIAGPYYSSESHE